jgi:hypothetical protein
LFTTFVFSSIYSFRVIKDQKFIKQVLEERLSIGQRLFINKPLLIKPEDETERGKIIIKDLGLEYDLSDLDAQHKDLINASNLILKDIVGVVDLNYEQKFKILFYKSFFNGLPFAAIIPGGNLVFDLDMFYLFADEAQLAGVLCHEVGHQVLFHFARSQEYSEGLWYPFYYPAKFFFMGFRIPLIDFFVEGARKKGEQEEADILAVQYMFKLGYDSTSYIKFEQKYFNDNRVRACQVEFNELKKTFPNKELKTFRYTNAGHFSKSINSHMRGR